MISLELLHPPHLESSDDRLDLCLGLIYIASHLRNSFGEKEVSVKINDLSGKQSSEWLIGFADIYGITVYAPSMITAQEIIKQCKEINPKAKIIVGGAHPSAVPEIFEGIADHVVIGYGEQSVADIVENYIKGEQPLPFVVKSSKMFDMFQKPAYDLVDMGSYSRLIGGEKSVPVLTARGCPFHCAFCGLSKMHNLSKGVQFAKPEVVIDQIKFLIDQYGVKAINFQDDVFTLKKERFAKLLKLLTPLNLKFRCHGRAGVDTEETYKMLADAGCVQVAWGIECLPKGELIPTNKGLKPIEDIRVGDKVFGEKNLVLDLSAVTACFSGKVKGYSVLKTDNTLLKCSQKHVLFTLGDKGVEEKESRELKIGDWIAVPNKISYEGTRVFDYASENKCRLIGYAIGDGCLDVRHGLRITDVDRGLLLKYNECAKNSGYIFGRILPSKNTNILQFNKECKWKRISNNSSEIIEFGGVCGLVKNLMGLSPQRTLPDYIASASSLEISAFLSGIFDAEGCVTKDRIQFGLSSLSLLEGVKFLLMRLGIFTGKIRRNKKIIQTKLFYFYVFTIKSTYSLTLFQELVGFWQEEKKAKLCALIEGREARYNKTKTRHSHVQSIPLTKKFIKNWCASNKTTYSKLQTKISGHIHSNSAFSKTTVSKLLLELPLGKEAELVGRLLIGDIAWRKIRSLEFFDDELPMYDITTTCGNYIASGALVHNSGSQYMLDRMNKKATVKENFDVISWAKKYNIDTRAFFVIGFPGETKETLEETKQFIIDADPDQYFVSSFVPYPATDPWNNPEKYGIIKMDRDFSQFYQIDKTGYGGLSIDTKWLTREEFRELEKEFRGWMKEHKPLRGNLQTYEQGVSK